jgi:hypothetical protein
VSLPFPLKRLCVQVNTSTVTNLLGGGVSGFGNLFSQLPKGVLCTDCTHAQVTKLSGLVSQAAGNSTTSGALSAVSKTCGAQFVDGSIPSTVGEKSTAASGTTTSGGSGATSNPNVSSAPISAAGRAGLNGAGLVAALVGVVTFSAVGVFATFA